ncbi:unnamed protein product [Rangifer tarandus platyrhynchus]|uniref:Uncharacterized protein n=1 Tax=Rangifer tarandus platyrhynchus TaxID=3082113 RepID=A0AC59YFN1_RANTA
MSTFMPNMTILSDTYGSASHRLMAFFQPLLQQWSGVVDSSSPTISHILHQRLLCRLCGWLWGASQSFRVTGKAGSARELTHCGHSGPFCLLSCDLSIRRHFYTPPQEVPTVTESSCSLQ